MARRVSAGGRQFLDRRSVATLDLGHRHAAPGYVGTFDAAVLLALRSLQLPALGYLLVLRFVLFVPITIAGFAVFVARYARRRR